MTHHRSITELLAAASSRTPIVGGDGKSGVPMERVEVDGVRYVLKHLSPGDDWIMRLTGDQGFRPWRLWASPEWERLPGSIDPAVVDMERAGDRLTVLMRDVGEWLVPDDTTVIARARHRRFLDHMAELHATFWGWTDDLGLLPLARRYSWFSPEAIAPELARPVPPVPVALAAEGWSRLAERAPAMAAVVRRLHADPAPLVSALERTPRTLVHGDWKLSNLGTAPDGRTILLDWANPGAAPPLYDLAHYVCLNVHRIPGPPDDAIAAYRASLESRGIATARWWDEQLELCLLGHMLLLGWNKALDSDDELAWWERRVLGAARRLG